MLGVLFNVIWDYMKTRVRHTTESIKNLLAKESYTLLSEYVNAKTSFRLKCPDGYEYSTSIEKWNMGRRCAHCNGSAKFTQEFIASEYAKVGYTLKSVYKNANSKNTIECDKGHIYESSYTVLRTGHFCPYCNGGIALSQDVVSSVLSKEGYTLASEYVNNHTHFSFICPNSHQGSMSFMAWRIGVRCLDCQGINRYDADKVKAILKSEEYTLLGDYVKYHIPFRFVCPKKHEGSMYLSQWNNGFRCMTCQGKNRYDTDKIKAILGTEDYRLLSEYKNYETKLKIQCPNNHLYETSFMVWYMGSRCPSCATYGFNPEKPGILYYIKFHTKVGDLYKIGITNLSIEARFSKEKTPYTIIGQQHFPYGRLAQEKETQILNDYKKWKYNGEYLLQSGNTELFVKDILGLDKQI